MYPLCKAKRLGCTGSWQHQPKGCCQCEEAWLLTLGGGARAAAVKLHLPEPGRAALANCWEDPQVSPLQQEPNSWVTGSKSNENCLPVRDGHRMKEGVSWATEKLSCGVISLFSSEEDVQRMALHGGRGGGAQDLEHQPWHEGWLSFSPCRWMEGTVFAGSLWSWASHPPSWGVLAVARTFL